MKSITQENPCGCAVACVAQIIKNPNSKTFKTQNFSKVI